MKKRVLLQQISKNVETVLKLGDGQRLEESGGALLEKVFLDSEWTVNSYSCEGSEVEEENY